MRQDNGVSSILVRRPGNSQMPAIQGSKRNHSEARSKTLHIRDIATFASWYVDGAQQH
jgi:S-adenosylmethionine hydrolase